MPSNNAVAVNIAMLGRSGSGKTSIIAAMLAEAKGLNDQSGASVHEEVVDLVYADRPTATLLDDNKNRLEGSIKAKTFDQKALPGNVDAAEYLLQFTPLGGARPLMFARALLNKGVNVAAEMAEKETPLAVLVTKPVREATENPTLVLEIKDYPGGWTDRINQERDDAVNEDWEQYMKYVADSSVLIIPVDALALMEARSKDQAERITGMIGFSMIEEVVDHWIANRLRSNLVNARMPAMLILAPTRCESYLRGVNGVDRSTELLEQTYQYYGKASLERLEQRDRFGLISVEYHPIETIGCVRLESVSWPANGAPTGERPEAVYRVAPPGKYAPKGADDLVISLFMFLTNVLKAEQSQTERGISPLTQLTRFVFGFLNNTAFEHTLDHMNRARAEGRTTGRFRDLRQYHRESERLNRDRGDNAFDECAFDHDDIEQLYLRLAKACHPDRTADKVDKLQRTRLMQEINEARVGADLARMQEIAKYFGILQ